MATAPIQSATETFFYLSHIPTLSDTHIVISSPVQQHMHTDDVMRGKVARPSQKKGNPRGQSF